LGFAWIAATFVFARRFVALRQPGCDLLDGDWRPLPVDLHARVADLQHMAETIQERMNELVEDAAAATVTMRKVEPEASPVRVPSREWRGLVRDKAKLLDQIEDSLGQKSQQAAVMVGDNGGLRTRQIIAGMRGREGGPAPVTEGPQPYTEPAPLTSLERFDKDQQEAKRRWFDQLSSSKRLNTRRPIRTGKPRKQPSGKRSRNCLRRFGSG
jgi:hypothetical protein